MDSLMTLAEAKTRLKIPGLWRHLNLPGTPRKSCHCPWREDKNPSFSVSENGLLFNDFATGESGDAVDFLRLATGLSEKGACRKFIELAGGLPSTPLPILRRAAAPAKARELPKLPAMQRGNRGIHTQLAALRNIHVEAVRAAVASRLLRFGLWKGHLAWFITDPFRRNAQARRLDGQPWPEIDAKAQTLHGCWASWPIGAALADYQTILFCEGGPDLLAALHFMYMHGGTTFGVVAMLGAGLRIHPEALPWFANKRVRIYAHADKAGREAAERWAAQLKSVGCRVDAVDCGGHRMQDGRTSNDLNDLTQIHPVDAGELSNLLPDEDTI